MTAGAEAWPPHPLLVRPPQYLGQLHDYKARQEAAVRRLALNLRPEVRAGVEDVVRARLREVRR